MAASFGWGSAGVGVRSAFDEGFGPFAQVAIRAGIASIALVGWLLLRRGTVGADPHTRRIALVLGLFNFTLPYFLFTIAYEHASAGFVGLTAALIPVATAGVAHVVLPDERLTPVKLLGLAVAAVGVAVLGLSGDSGLEEGGRPALALALGAVAVIGIAFASVHAKKHAGTYDSLEVTGLSFVVGAVIALVVLPFTDGWPSAGTGTGWAIMLYLALVSTVLPFATFYWVLRHTTVTHAQLTAYLVPIIAVVAGVVVLSEQLQPGIVIGGGLILAGVVITDVMERQKRSDSAPPADIHSTGVPRQ